MPVVTFTRAFLLMFAGPLIWVAHFLFVYVLNGVVCARPAVQAEWLGIGATSWGINIATIVAISAIAAIQLRIRARSTQAGNPDFIDWLAAMLSLLAVIAIIWETLPIFLVPACE
jgi:hypothetical protein